MDPKQLPHLLQLLDDDSPGVQEALSGHLVAWGEDLKIELARMAVPPSERQRRLLQAALGPQNRVWLRRVWPAWLELPNTFETLEQGCSLISEFHSGYIYPTDLGIVLDQLAQDYRREHPRPDALGLAAYLHRERGLKAAGDDFFNPLNSDLMAVIKEKRGIPLSLSLVYLFVGRRLQLDVAPFPLPGHFLARVREGGREFLVDCYNGGVEADPKVLEALGEPGPEGGRARSDAGPRAVMARMLRNLAKAYEEHRRPEDLSLVAELSVRLERDDLARTGPGAGTAGSPAGPVFSTGSVVRSRRWGFRAVVVDFDLSCKAPETWRRRRGDGARLGQPWYHLFVDQSGQVAYAPEESLEAEDPPGAVEHPLLSHFFDRDGRGRYWRNLRRWPGTSS